MQSAMASILQQFFMKLKIMYWTEPPNLIILKRILIGFACIDQDYRYIVHIWIRLGSSPVKLKILNSFLFLPLCDFTMWKWAFCKYEIKVGIEVVFEFEFNYQIGNNKEKTTKVTKQILTFHSVALCAQAKHVYTDKVLFPKTLALTDFSPVWYFNQ